MLPFQNDLSKVDAFRGFVPAKQRPLPQVTMAEDEFRRRDAEIAVALSQPHVRDVWEERLPLALDAALSVGCVASVAPAVRSRPLSDGFDLTDLQVHGVSSRCNRSQSYL